MVICLSQTNDYKVILKFSKEHILSQFGTPKTIIIDQGVYFCNALFARLMEHYGATHKVSTIYHPQINGQAEL